MKVIAINGSPRKNWNTNILLEKCLEGAKGKGAEVELIHLYDIDFKGCMSCFGCKRKGIVVKKCLLKDDLETILQKICDCDVLVLGSPIYFSSITSKMRALWERMIFPYSSYELKPSTFGKKINTAFIYTMNALGFALPLIGYTKIFKKNAKQLKKTFGNSEYLISTSTYQFDDYGKYAITVFKGDKRLKRRETVFKKDCKKAFLLGERLVEGNNG